MIIRPGLPAASEVMYANTSAHMQGPFLDCSAVAGHDYRHQIIFCLGAHIAIADLCFDIQAIGARVGKVEAATKKHAISLQGTLGVVAQHSARLLETNLHLEDLDNHVQQYPGSISRIPDWD